MIEIRFLHLTRNIDPDPRIHRVTGRFVSRSEDIITVPDPVSNHMADTDLVSNYNIDLKGYFF